MKVIGHKLEYIYDQGERTEVKKYLAVVLCSSVEIERKRGELPGKHSECRYFIHMSSYHPSKYYFICSNKRDKHGIYYGLTLAEAEKIVEKAATSDVIDLRELGDYHINCAGTIQTVMVTNDYDELDDEILPLEVKVVGK